jgi:hypothetical protein
MTVEFFGMARELAGAPQLEVGGERMTERELVAALAARCPQLVGPVIDPAALCFVAPNLLLLDGRRAAGDAPFAAADRPCVLFLASGG